MLHYQAAHRLVPKRSAVSQADSLAETQGAEAVSRGVVQGRLRAHYGGCGLDAGRQVAVSGQKEATVSSPVGRGCRASAARAVQTRRHA